MTVAKQGLIVAELIDRGIVNAIVSTGALMAHGLVEATGRSHFRYNPDVPDTELYEQGLRDPKRAPTLRETGEMLAAIQGREQDRWLFRLWFECLSQAGRDDDLRELAATFWRGNRARGAKLVETAMPDLADRAKAISTALIALDIGLAIQHFVDPDDVPLALYPELYELLFGHLAH